MSINLLRPPEVDAPVAPSDGLNAFEPSENSTDATTTSPSENSHALAALSSQTLAALPLGAHLILRCRKDWRDATIIAIAPDKITLSVNAPSGRTYRVRRPPDTALIIENSLPVIGTGSWRVNFARYDGRW